MIPAKISLNQRGLVCALALVFGAAGLRAEELKSSEWVFPGSDGKLVYKTTPAGDRIMDFSHAGYRGGGVALPNVLVKRTVQPSGGADDTAAIQAAIDEVAALPLENGFRGAVLLAPGAFTCAQTITIAVGGVVLRGSGATGENRSTIRMTGGRHTALIVGLGRNRSRRTPGSEREAPQVQTSLADAYVPSGARTFTVADTKGFAVGDTIELRRPVTAAWVKLLQMDDLTRDGRPQTWMRTGDTLVTERRIAALTGNTVTLDVPLSDSFDATYLNPPGTIVAKVTPPTRLTQAGVEHLHIESPSQEVNHTQELYTAVRLYGEDCWIRNVAIDETMNSVGVGGRRITLQGVTVRRKARHQGASKPAEFAPNASEILLDRCAVIADNVWFVATGAAQAGPIVLLNCNFQGNGRAEAHQRWSTGMLYDNCRAPTGGFEMRNRGSMGSGHGWSMGWGVLWNCEAAELLVQNPPGAANWLIGSRGHRGSAPRPFGSGPPLPGGIDDSPDAAVTPRSLYLAQLAERLGPQALKNIGYASADPASAIAETVATPIPTSVTTAAKTSSALGPNLAADRPVLASNTRGNQRDFAGWLALDDDDATCWATDDGVADARLELDTEGAFEINALELREAPGKLGQVRAYRVEGFVNSAWQPLAQGTTVGESAILRFPNVTVWKVRLTILKAEPYAAISRFGLYRETRSPNSP